MRVGGWTWQRGELGAVSRFGARPVLTLATRPCLQSATRCCWAPAPTATAWRRLRCSTRCWCAGTARASGAPTPSSARRSSSTCRAAPTRGSRSRWGAGRGGHVGRNDGWEGTCSQCMARRHQLSEAWNHACRPSMPPPHSSRWTWAPRWRWWRCFAPRWRPTSGPTPTSLAAAAQVGCGVRHALCAANATLTDPQADHPLPPPPPQPTPTPCAVCSERAVPGGPHEGEHLHLVRLQPQWRRRGAHRSCQVGVGGWVGLRAWGYH